MSKTCKNCGKCSHFVSSGKTVSEMDPSYLGTAYADVQVGACELPDHEFPSREFPFADRRADNVHAMRWATHVQCIDFDG